VLLERRGVEMDYFEKTDNAKRKQPFNKGEVKTQTSLARSTTSTKPTPEKYTFESSQDVLTSLRHSPLIDLTCGE
jgi:hypothetical protein